MPGKDTWDNIIRVRKLILFNHVNWYQAHFFGQWGVPIVNVYRSDNS